MSVPMIAKKRVKYPHGHTGREYSPGQSFDALSERDAKGLYVAGKADYDKTGGVGGPKKNLTDLPKPAKPKEPEPVAEIAGLREEYQALIGRRAFPGWDADELRTRMADYRRSDMRAGSGEYQTTAMEAEE